MDLIKDLTCPVCLELLSRPVVLPCSHVLCQRPCAETIFEVSFARCPVCREKFGIGVSFTNLPRVLALDNIIENIRSVQKQAEANQTNAAESSTPYVTSDSLQSTMCENSDACSPVRSLNNSCISPMNEFNVKKAGLESINQNDMTNHVMYPGQECSNKENTIHPSASMSRIVSHCDVSEEFGVSAVSGGSSSQKEMVSISSYIEPVSRNRFYAGHVYSDDRTGEAYFDTRMKRQVHEQLRKLSEFQSQLLDTVTSYRKCAPVCEDQQKALMQRAPIMLNRLSAVVLKCNRCLMTFESRMQSYQSTNERAPQRDVTNHAKPGQPVIDIQRSTRNHNSVALVICPPPFCDDISGYEITYFGEDQKQQHLKKHLEAKWPINTTTISKWRTYVLIEGLSDSTNYCFSACAVNRTGRSPSSDYVMCRTLSHQGCVVPAPILVKNSCSSSSTSSTIICSSPRKATRSQGISYFLLVRKGGSNFVWHGEEMPEAKEHQVSNLETDTCYQFVVLACDSRGESQTSERITLTTLDVGEKECNRVVGLVC